MKRHPWAGFYVFVRNLGKKMEAWTGVEPV